MQRLSSIAFCLLLVSSPVTAEVQSKSVQYRHGDVPLQGYLAWDDSLEGKRPGVLVVHEWWGLNDYARKRANELAKLGYVAFALDMYGAGKVTEHPAEAGEWAGQIRKNVAAWRERATLGLDMLKKSPHVDPARVAAIGYCFGGATVIQLAYADAPVLGVVSFHGSLPVVPDDVEKIAPRILVCHGDSDGFVPKENIESFRKGLDRAGADWHFVSYGGARHSFTNPDADSKGIDGLRYDPKADQRSWSHMKTFFAEIFAPAE